MSPELAEVVARLAEGIADGGSPALPGGSWMVREFGIADVQAVLVALAEAEQERDQWRNVATGLKASRDERDATIAHLETVIDKGGPPPMTLWQCRWHYGPPVTERMVSIDVSHAPRSGAWQHTGPVCRGCREHLRGLYRRCRCGEQPPGTGAGVHSPRPRAARAQQ